MKKAHSLSESNEEEKKFKELSAQLGFPVNPKTIYKGERFDECPVCGAYWGHPNKDLDFPNRWKVRDEDGVWWKCYNCWSYYNPFGSMVDLKDGRRLRYDQLPVKK